MKMSKDDQVFDFSNLHTLEFAFFTFDVKLRRASNAQFYINRSKCNNIFILLTYVCIIYLSQTEVARHLELTYPARSVTTARSTYVTSC